MYDLNIRTIQPYSSLVGTESVISDVGGVGGIAENGGFSSALAQAAGIVSENLSPMSSREADAQLEDAQTLLYNAMKAFDLDAGDSEELLSALQTLIDNINDPDKQAEMNALMPIIAQLLSVQNSEDLTPPEDYGAYDASLITNSGQNDSEPQIFSADAANTLSNTITGINAGQTGSAYAQLMNQLNGGDQTAQVTQTTQTTQTGQVTQDYPAENYPQTAIASYSDAANLIGRVTTVTYTELTLTVNSNVLSGADNSLLNQIAALLGLDQSAVSGTATAGNGTNVTANLGNGNVWSAAQTIIQQFDLMTQNGNLTLSQANVTQTGGNLLGTDLQSLFQQMRSMFGLGGLVNTTSTPTDLSSILGAMGVLGTAQATQTTQQTQNTATPIIPNPAIPTGQTDKAAQTYDPNWIIEGVLNYPETTLPTVTIGGDTALQTTDDSGLFIVDDSGFAGGLSETEDGVSGMTLGDLGLMYGVTAEEDSGVATANDTGIILEDNAVEVLVDDGTPGELDFGSVAQNLASLTPFETQYVAPEVGRQTTSAIQSQLQQFPLHIGESSGFEVTLNPESLGKISIKLTNENGTVSIQLTAEDAKTQAMLFERGEAIQHALRENGVTFERFVIQQPAAEEAYEGNQGGGTYEGYDSEPNEEHANEGANEDGIPEDEESGMTFEELLYVG
jgi:hypothetical protein